MIFKPSKKQLEFMSIPLDVEIKPYMNDENPYNTERPRLVECPQCHKQEWSTVMAPRCPIDGREMITIIKDIPLRIK